MKNIREKFFDYFWDYKGIIWTLVMILASILFYIFVFEFYKPSASEPEFVLRYAENQAEDYPTTQGAIYFSQLVEERTNGRIKILVYSGGELGRELDVITQLQYGGIDFTRVSISQMAAIESDFNVLQMPYLYRDSDHMWSVLDGEIGYDFLNSVEEDDLIGLSWYDAGTRNFYNSVKPITCLEDMEGMKIRVQDSSLMEDAIRSLGATPVAISYEEVYSALETGEVDGAENNWPSYESMVHYEVAPYWTQDEHTRIPEIQLCSKHTWEQFSKEDQEIILEAAKESALYERELWTERETSTKNAVIAKGVQVVELSDEEKQRFQDAMQGVYEKYCADNMDVLEEIMAVE